MRRRTKAKLSTAVGVVLGGITLQPVIGCWTADYQCRHGLCPHPWHRHRYPGKR